MIDAFLHGLGVQTLALSLGVVVVRALQLTVMRQLGASAAYLAWLVLPAVMVTVALPHASVDALAVRLDVAAVTPSWVAAPPIERADRPVVAKAIVVAWAVGGALFSALLMLRQRRFGSLVVASAGEDERRLPAGAGPAVLGVWRPRIVLPQDFDSAFCAEERRLMLLHESVHLRRGDNAWNLLAAALLVLHWFNPFAWWAWRRMRADQEAACDAAVLRNESSDSLTTYAGALLKVQGVALGPPLATPWQSTHPLVERVRMLQLHRISPARHRAGLRVAALCILVAGIGGYTLQAGADALPASLSVDDESVMTTLEITQTSARATPTDAADKVSIGTNVRLLSRMGQPARVRIDDAQSGAKPFEFGLTVSRLDGDRLQVDTRLSAGTPLAVLGSPRLIVHDGEKASVSIETGDPAGAFTISLAPKVVAGSSADAVDTRKPPSLPSPPPQSVRAFPALPRVDAMPPVPVAPTPRSLPALPPVPADPSPPPQRAP